MLYKKTSPVQCRSGILYGQAKVHKPVINNCPSFRPTLDAINTPSYKLAKFIVPILSPMVIDEYTAKDSFDNSLYRQIDWVAMGSPWGPSLANDFLCHYEKVCLDSYPVEFKPKL